MRSRQSIESLESRLLFANGPGTLDTTFNGTGTLKDTFFADVSRVIVQPDGKILVASIPDVLLSGKGVLQRYLPNGQFDPSFHDPNGSNTGYQLTSLTTDIALTSNNEIICLGGNSLTELASSGYHDSTFGVNGTPIPGTGARMSLDRANNIDVAYYNSSQNIVIRQYTANGTWNTSFGNGGDTNVSAAFPTFEFRDIGVAFDHSVYLFGNDNFGGGSDFSVVHLLPGGKIDTTFGSSGRVDVSLGNFTDERVWSGIVTPDNNLLIGGEVGGQMAVARLNKAGQLDTSFNGSGRKIITLGAFSIVRSLAIAPDGQILLGGRTNGAANNNGDFAVVKLNTNGSFDKSFNQTGIATADLGTSFDSGTSIAVASDGRVILGGDVYYPDNFTQALRMGMAVFRGSILPDTNDQISEASTVSIGSTFHASISSPNDVDLFKFTAKAGHRILFTLSQPGADQFDPFLRIFDSKGNEIVDEDTGAPVGLVILGPSVKPHVDYTFSTTGTYYLGVSSRPNTTYNAVTGADGNVRGFAGQYSVAIADLTNTPGSHNTIAKAIKPSVVDLALVVSTAIISSSDVVMIAFTLGGTTPGKVSIDEDTLAGGFNSYLRLFDSKGKQLAANDNGAAPGETLKTDSYLSMTLNPGTYYVGISTNKNKTYNPVTGAGAISGGALGSFNVIINLPIVLHR